MLKTFFGIKSVGKAVLSFSVILFVTSCVQTNYNDLKPTPVDMNKPSNGADVNLDKSKIKTSDQALIDKNSADKIDIKKAAKTAHKSPSQASIKNAPKSGRIKFNASWKCVPRKLKTVIYQVSQKFGPVIVNSTNRSRRKNRRIGGAKKSWHIGCRAVDFRVKGRTRGLYSWLRKHPNVGGLKRYRSGFYHIDIGPRRSW